MDTQVTLTLPSDVYQQASNIASMTGWSVEDALLVMLEVPLPALIPVVDLRKPLESLSDSQIVALTQLEMAPEYDVLHSALLYRQQANTLSPTERRELHTLQRVYEIGMIFKSRALAESVRRGIRESLQS